MKIFLKTMISAIFLSLLLQLAAAQDSNYSYSDKVAMNFDTKTFLAKGVGICDLEEGISSAEAKLSAERAAIADAQRKLAETVVGIKVTADTIVEDYVTKNDKVKTSVRAFVKGARPVGDVIYKQEGKQIIAEVTLEAPVNGEGGFSNVILPYVRTNIIDKTKPLILPEDVKVKKNIRTEDVKPGKSLDISKIEMIVVSAKSTNEEKKVDLPKESSETPKNETKKSDKTDKPEEKATAEPVPSKESVKSEEKAEAGKEVKPEVTPESPKPDITQPADKTDKKEIPVEKKPEPTPIKNDEKPQENKQESSEQKKESVELSDGQPVKIIITGVIFNTQGKKYNVPMFPEVINEEGKSVFNILKIKEDSAKDFSWPYTSNKDMAANNQRVKLTPIEISAKDIDKDLIIITNEDALKILSISKENYILENGKVLFLVDQLQGEKK